MAGHRILVVDENARARKILGEELNLSAACVFLANSAGHALDFARKESFDIVFADLHLSGRDGISLLWELRQLHSELSAVIMSASGSLESAIEAIRSGVADYLVKPLTRHNIQAAFDRATKAVAESRKTRHAPLPRFVPEASLDVPVAASDSMRRVFTVAARCALSDVPVVLQGEFGVGKETVARMIHRRSGRAARPFEKIDCSAITDRFVQSLLFERDHASHSLAAALPALDAVRGGTLYLHDVDSLPPSAQRLIIEKLEEQYSLAAKGKDEGAGLRLIVGTTKPSLVGEQFLLYRTIVNGWGGTLLEIPPLRARVEDILPLAGHFLRQVVAPLPHPLPDSFSREAIDCLHRYSWPGNACELRMVVRHAMNSDDESVITHEALPGSVRSARTRDGDTIQVPLLGDFRETQRHLARTVISRFDGNKTAAAKALGLNRRKLYRLLEEGRSA